MAPRVPEPHLLLVQLLLRQALASLHIPAPHHAVLAGRQQHAVLVGPVQPRDAPAGAGQPQDLRQRGVRGSGGKAGRVSSVVDCSM